MTHANTPQALLPTILATILWGGVFVPAVARELCHISIVVEKAPPDCPAMGFIPGRLHALRVEPNWPQLPRTALRVHVTRHLPDGRTVPLEASISPGEAAELPLGPLCMPPVFDFEAGALYRRGYSLDVRLTDEVGRPLYSVSYSQGLAEQHVRRTAGTAVPAGVERFIPETRRRVLYLHQYGIEAALQLRLHEAVLDDQDRLVAQCRLAPEAPVGELSCRLTVLDEQGAVLLEEDVAVQAADKWQAVPLDPGNWPPGKYRIRLDPAIEGTLWDEGATVTYHRSTPDPLAVPISRSAPWTLQADPTRETVLIEDFSAASIDGEKLPAGWSLEQTPQGRALVAAVGAEPEPVHLKPLSGTYAVFATPHASGCLLQIGRDGLVRSLGSDTATADTFVCATDLTEQGIRVYAFDPWNRPRSGLARLKLVPVTAQSAEALYAETSRPPVPLFAVDDWCEYFHGPCRLQADQFSAILAGQAELGLSTVNWSIGRSWVEYHSELPNTTRFPAVPLEEAAKTFDRAPLYQGRATMINSFDALDEVLAARGNAEVALRPWLSMNRHYGNAYGGIFASQWFLSHPEWRRWRKGAREAESSAVSYYFREVRKERVDILLEVARRGVDGLLVGACRQVPMLLYNPEMVAAFKAETGIDPQSIDASSGDAYLRWIRGRADHFTHVLRDLQEGLGPIEAEMGRRIPVVVRIPSSGLLYNLAQGLDVETWLREGLVDQLQLDPLETWGGRGDHDVTAYVELCHRHGVTVIGGVGATWTNAAGRTAALRRALGLLQAGVDGIEVYEAELQAKCSDRRWALALFGNERRLRDYLASSNQEACYPVTSSTAAFGHDNHSNWDDAGFSIHSKGANGL